MRKNNFKCVLLLLLALGLIVSFFKGLAYSKTDNSGTVIPLGFNPYSIAINPETNVAVITGEERDHDDHAEGSEREPRDHDSEEHGLVSVIDLDTQTVISTISVDKKPKNVAIDRELNIALIGSSKSDTVSVLDLNTFSIIKTIPVGKEPNSIAVNQLTHIALVSNRKDGTVSVVDLVTYKVIKTIFISEKVGDVAVDHMLNIALVVNEEARHDEEDEKNREGHTVSVIDLGEYRITSKISVGKKPQAIDINPETHLAAVANEKDNSITTIDLYTWKTTSIPVEKHPVDVVINPLDNRAIVICDENRSLVLVNLDKNAIVKDYSLYEKPKRVAINSYTNIAALIDEKTDSLILLQLSNPVPIIDSIKPGTFLRGNSNVKITVEGSKFIKTSAVSLQSAIDSYDVIPKFMDNHSLEAEIPAGLLQKTGNYQITVINPEPEGGISNPHELKVINPMPQISVLDPLETTAGTPFLTLTVYGTGFFDDTTVYINDIPRSFTLLSPTKLQIELAASDLEVGAHLQVTASNPPPGGGLSNHTIFTVLNPVPTLSSIDPTSIIAGSPDFTLTLTGDNFVKTSIVSFNNQQFPSRYTNKNQIEATITSDVIKTPESYSVKVINPTPGGGESPSLTFIVKLPLEIKITSPNDGETINRSKIMVKGTIKSDTKDVSIKVNGILAEMVGSEWAANDVPLTVGSNTIVASVTDYHGNMDAKTITIYTSEMAQPVELSSNMTSGIGPLQASFAAFASSASVSYQMDFEGDGIYDYTGVNFENISHIYATEGIFYPTIRMEDDQGNILYLLNKSGENQKSP